MASRIAAIDLFAGAGGLSLGAVDAGCDVRLSVDNDEVSCRTVEANSRLLGGKAECADVSELSGADLRRLAGLEDSDPLLVIGGAPCQPFSKAAYWVEAGDDAAWRRDRANGVIRPRPPAPEAARPDDRRTLIGHFIRLVIEADADGFVFENVSAIQHPRNRPLLNALVYEANESGYSTTVVKAVSSDFGVAQHRERVFVLGSRAAPPIAPSPT